MTRFIRPCLTDAADIEHVLAHPAQHPQILFVERVESRRADFRVVEFLDGGTAVAVDDFQVFRLGDAGGIDRQRDGDGKRLPGDGDVIRPFVDAGDSVLRDFQRRIQGGAAVFRREMRAERLHAVIEPVGGGAGRDPFVAALVIFRQVGVCFDENRHELVPFDVERGDGAGRFCGNGSALRNAGEHQLNFGVAAACAEDVGAVCAGPVFKPVGIRPFGCFDSRHFHVG